MTTHVEDGALVRYLDGEDAAGDLGDVGAHVDRCDRCAARMAELARAADTLSAALRAADVPVPRRRPPPPWGLRAAAALLVLAGVGGAVRPVRAWILDRAGAVWVAVTGREPTAPPDGAAPERSASVSFVPAGDVLTLEVTEHQQGGVLHIETVGGDTAVAIVRGGAGAESLVVLPSTLRIVNRPASSASYVIRVPARLTRVRVRVSDAEPWDYRPGGAPREIDLGNR